MEPLETVTPNRDGVKHGGFSDVGFRISDIFRTPPRGSSCLYLVGTGRISCSAAVPEMDSRRDKFLRVVAVWNRASKQENCMLGKGLYRLVKAGFSLKAEKRYWVDFPFVRAVEHCVGTALDVGCWTFRRSHPEPAGR